MTELKKIEITSSRELDALFLEHLGWRWAYSPLDTRDEVGIMFLSPEDLKLTDTFRPLPKEPSPKDKRKALIGSRAPRLSRDLGEAEAVIKTMQAKGYCCMMGASCDEKLQPPYWASFYPAGEFTEAKAQAVTDKGLATAIVLAALKTIGIEAVYTGNPK